MKILIDGQTFETPEIHRGIGVYTKNVINQMVKQNYEVEWYIALSNDRNLVELDPWVRQRLHVIVAEDMTPCTDYTRNARYTAKLEELIDNYDIDALWLPNGLMVNVLFLSRAVSCPVFLTVYDLIPYLYPIKEWPEPITREYMRRLEMAKSEPNIHLVMISEATLRDWQEKLGDRESHAVVTFLSADSRLFYCKRTTEIAANPYILFTGGFDYRKNVDGAIASYALARKKHAEDEDFQRYHLVIVGKYDAATKEKYDKYIRSMGLESLVRLTGFVSDQELARLYRNADIFFFPSKYEGFGLPLLEAMLSGDYIVSADNSSLPEVCGEYAVLFDVNNQEEMADALYQGYKNRKEETLEDIQRRQEYALSFSWDRTAQGTLEMIERYSAPCVSSEKHPKLAIFSPWPEQKTGIANYMYKLTPYLMEYFDVTIFTSAPKTKRRPLAGVNIRDLNSFSSKEEFDYKLYQIGNNADFHKEIFDLLEQYGGIAEIHDFILTPFFFVSYYGQGQKQKFEKLLKLGYGPKKGQEFYDLTVSTGNHPDVFDCPMAHSVAALADKTILHNHWSTDQLAGDNACVVPLASFPMHEPESIAMEAAEKKLIRLFEKENGEVLIGCFGWVNANKRPEVVIQAVSELKKRGYTPKLVFWGENNVQNLNELISDYDLKNQVFVSGYLDADEYYAALRKSDIVVNLRFPSMGEASATLCEAFKMGKPTIVSDLNQYREYPDDVCWKLPVGEQEVEMLCAYISYLIDHPEVREALGGNAKAYADYALAPERIAKLYYTCITGAEGGVL